MPLVLKEGSNATTVLKTCRKKSYPFISLGCQRESSEAAFALAGLLSTENGIIAEAAVFFAS